MKILSTYRKIYLYISRKSILRKLSSIVNEIVSAIDLICENAT